MTLLYAVRLKLCVLQRVHTESLFNPLSLYLSLPLSVTLSLFWMQPSDRCYRNISDESFASAITVQCVLWRQALLTMHDLWQLCFWSQNQLWRQGHCWSNFDVLVWGSFGNNVIPITCSLKCVAHLISCTDRTAHGVGACGVPQHT